MPGDRGWRRPLGHIPGDSPSLATRRGAISRKRNDPSHSAGWNSSAWGAPKSTGLRWGENGNERGRTSGWAVAAETGECEKWGGEGEGSSGWAAAGGGGWEGWGANDNEGNSSAWAAAGSGGWDTCPNPVDAKTRTGPSNESHRDKTTPTESRPQLALSTNNSAKPVVDSTPSAERVSPSTPAKQSYMAHTVSPSASDTSASISTLRPSQRGGYGTPHQHLHKAWTKLVQTMERTVRVYLDLQKAEEDYERWKRTQMSACFEKPSELAKTILDKIRYQYRKRITDARHTLDKLVKTMLDFPELSRDWPDLKRDTDSQEINRYRDELKSYVEDVRPLLIEIANRKPCQQSAVESSPYGPDRPSPVGHELTVSSADTSRVSTIDSIRSGIKYLKCRLEDIDGDIFTTSFAKEEGELIPNNQDTAAALYLELLRKSYHLTDGMRTITDNNGDLTKRISFLSMKRDNQKTEMNAQKNKFANLEAAQFQMYSELALLKKMRQEDAKKIQLLSDQHGHGQSPSVPAVSPIMLKQVETIVAERMYSDLAPHLKMIQSTLVEELRASDRHIYQEVWERCEPALKLTESIYRLIEKP